MRSGRLSPDRDGILDIVLVLKYNFRNIFSFKEFKFVIISLIMLRLELAYT